MLIETEHRTKVLIVAMVDSIHVARWLELFRKTKYDFTIISSSPNRRIHPRLDALAKSNQSSGATYKIHPFSRWLSVPAWLIDRILQDRIRGWLICRTIRSLHPDFVHAMELQNAGYATSVAFENLTPENRPPLLVTNYGSDIYWFERFENHRERLSKLLGLVDAYSAECSRDRALAENLGLRAKTVQIFPNSGGLEPDALADLSDQNINKKSLAIKGYENQFGRALLALAALEEVADLARPYEIVLFSCNRKTKIEARRLAKRANLKITCHGKNRLAHGEVLDLLRNSVLYLGLSGSDGISTSMLEAMSQGAVPLQSGTACANEWIKTGETGFILNLANQASIGQALKFTLENADFREQARARNLETIKTKYLSATVAAECREFYEAALSAK
jgi:glycosyltransferase involved in cell wall biosynthesis